MSLSHQANLRKAFHSTLLSSGVLSVNQGVVSNADKSSRPSVRLASAIYAQLSQNVAADEIKLSGQTAGAKFEQICAAYLSAAFKHLDAVRPGKWIIGCDGIQGGNGLAYFEQFAHLASLEELSRENPRLKAAIGSDYLIKPDVLVARQPEPDERIGSSVTSGLDFENARRTPFRAVNNSLMLLHATISCKWTIRSDRAQNARTEALNLMKNRKGRVPHVVVITGEPTPGRIASLAFGTGELDCVYHFALTELIEAVKKDDSAYDILSSMLDGNRLRDIADLPFDLAI
ncbi:NgoMIV family type II restriction endonuclease [Ahrensia sp. 13_GOM-1096m]|uniref:NgoMIV family type II restriction endonuclease n=1 Tax=Ahrensia sp. 13_GOM-1096m TaxID=1380380 RepID=UPI00055126ED|nr:NgoMIV family type II restriction endonuclease [Ahrensia sp. 13_GOM-1096m]